MQPVSGIPEKTVKYTSRDSSSGSQSSTEVPHTPMSRPNKFQNTVPKPFTPSSNLNQQAEPSSTSKSLADLPTFSPMLYPPCAFNYERPRHFIQSQPSFQAPSYDSLQSNGSSPSPYSSNLSSSIATTTSPSSPPQSAPPPVAMRSSVTLIPKVASSRCDDKTSSADFLCSVLPSQPTSQGKYISKSVPQSETPRTLQQPPPSQMSTNIVSPTPPKMSSKSMITATVPQHSSLVSQPVNFRETPKT